MASSSKKTTSTKAAKTPAKSTAAKPAAKKAAPAKEAASAAAPRSNAEVTPQSFLTNNHKERNLDPFTAAQREKLLFLRDAMVDSMAGVAQDTLRSRAEGSEASAF